MKTRRFHGAQNRNGYGWARRDQNKWASRKQQKRWLKYGKMKEFTITRQKVEDLLSNLVAISKPHPQVTTDGKTVTRDFEFTPKVRTFLLEDMTTLKLLSEEKETRRMNMVSTHLPRGEANHTQAELMAFQLEFQALMSEDVTVKLYQVLLYDEKTEKPDAIDLTKCPIPFNMMVDLNRIIIIRPPDPGNSDSSGDISVAPDLEPES